MFKTNAGVIPAVTTAHYQTGNATPVDVPITTANTVDVTLLTSDATKLTQVKVQGSTTSFTSQSSVPSGFIYYPPAAVTPSISFNVTDYGAVADGSTDNTAAFAACVTAAKAAGFGATIVFPPATAFYVGNLVLSGNFKFHVIGYGAVLFAAAASSIGIDINTQLGGSSLGATIEGLHVKGANITNIIGIRIKDCTNTRLNKCSIEQTATAIQLTNTVDGQVNGSESSFIEDVAINKCDIGIDFKMANTTPSTGSSPYFMNTMAEGVTINNAATACVRIGTNCVLGRSVLNFTGWVGGTAGALLDTDADMTDVCMSMGGELFGGASGGCGIRPRANTVNWIKSYISAEISGSLSPAVDTTLQPTGHPVIYRRGQTTNVQGKGSAAEVYYGPSVKNVTDSFPIVSLVTLGNIGTTGISGVAFGGGSSAPDTIFGWKSATRLGTNGGIALGDGTFIQGALYSSNGAPNGALGAVGDMCINIAGTAGTRLYAKTAVGTWTGIL